MNVEKESLRKAMQEIARGRIDACACSRDLVRLLNAWPVWREARTICAFCAISGEPDILDPWPIDKRIALPRVQGDEMSFHWISGRDELVPGRFGIWEPSPEASPAGFSFDLILVPGMAFDRRGGRLGRGRGYYDRFLASASGFLAGICFDDQLVPEVPCDSHDVRMNEVVTPSEIFPGVPKNTM